MRYQGVTNMLSWEHLPIPYKRLSFFLSFQSLNRVIPALIFACSKKTASVN